MNAEHQSKQWSQIVAKAWADAAFMRRLLADPAAVLKEHGIRMPAGVQVKVVEDTAQVRHLTLPVRPAGELRDEQLAAMAGGLSIINSLEC